MFLHLKYHPQGADCALLKLHTDLYVILVGHNELPEDGLLNIETCRSMLFIIVVFDIIVQSLVKL
jgi:hypothetical protein